MIRFQCPTCLKSLKAPEDGAGRKTHCPRCGQRLLVPAPAPALNRTALGQVMPSPADPPPKPNGQVSDWLSAVKQDEKAALPPPAAVPPAGKALVECPVCRSPMYAPDDLQGRRVACPKCKTSFAPHPPPPPVLPPHIDALEESPEQGLRVIPYYPEVVPAYEPSCREPSHRGTARGGHYRPCPACGCTERPRQVKKFGGTSWALFWVGIFLLWPLLIVAFFTQEVWNVCPDCGEWLEQTGTGC